MTAIRAELLRKLETDETVEACYLLQGQLQPPYQAVEFQIAVKTVIKALARLLAAPERTAKEANLFGESDFSPQEVAVTKLYKQKGDLGLVAEQVVTEAHLAPKHLSIVQVYEKLFLLAKDSGAQSQSRKLSALVEILRELEPVSAKF